MGIPKRFVLTNERHCSVDDRPPGILVVQKKRRSLTDS